MPLTGWTIHSIPVAFGNSQQDFDTLGVDKHGINVTTLQRTPPVNDGQTILAVKKPEIYSGVLNLTTFTIDTGPAATKVWTIQPAVNFDSSPAGGYAWLVAKGPPTHGTPYRGGEIYYRRLRWNGNAAELVDTSWQAVAGSQSYRDYFDLEDGPVKAPQLGDVGGPVINLKFTGSRLMNAVIRNGFLWTSHHVGLTGVAGTYTSTDTTGAQVDRSGLQWLKLQVSASGESLTYVAHGRVYDDCVANVNPTWYYFPSVMVNSSGDIALGFSGASAASFIGAYSWWRLADGTRADRPALLQAGLAHHPGAQFGDYSATTLDPTDGLSFWTVQEFAKDPSLEPPDIWGTWIAKLKSGP